MCNLVVAALLLLALTLGVSAGSPSCPKMYPVVLVPGVTGSMLKGRLDIAPDTPLPHSICERVTKLNETETFWLDAARFVPEQIDCLLSYIKFSWNPETHDFEPRHDVDIGAKNFGTLKDIEYVTPSPTLHMLSDYYHNVAVALRKVGYVDGQNLFGLSYDWRWFPSKLDWGEKTKALIEDAYEKNNQTKVNVVSHSMGGPWWYYFLMQQDTAWRAKYLHRWISVASSFSGTSETYYALFHGYTFHLPFSAKESAELCQSMPVAYFLLPIEEFFGSLPVISTPTSSYTPNDIPKLLLTRKNVSYAVEASEYAFNLLRPTNFEWPEGVDQVDCIWGYGVKTLEALEYASDDDIGIKEPTKIEGDGDGTVLTNSATGACFKWKESGHDVTYMPIKGTHHVGLIRHPKVADQIVEASCF